MTDNELLLAMSDIMDKKMQTLKEDLESQLNQSSQSLKGDLESQLKQSSQTLKEDLEAQLKQLEKNLKNEIHKSEYLILDEVERIHDILDKHKEDKSVHTA